jgi:hypothetical protein
MSHAPCQRAINACSYTYTHTHVPLAAWPRSRARPRPSMGSVPRAGETPRGLPRLGRQSCRKSCSRVTPSVGTLTHSHTHTHAFTQTSTTIESFEMFLVQSKIHGRCRLQPAMCWSRSRRHGCVLFPSSAGLCVNVSWSTCVGRAHTHGGG